MSPVYDMQCPNSKCKHSFPDIYAQSSEIGTLKCDKCDSILQVDFTNWNTSHKKSDFHEKDGRVHSFEYSYHDENGKTHTGKINPSRFH